MLECADCADEILATVSNLRNLRKLIEICMFKETFSFTGNDKICVISGNLRQVYYQHNSTQ